VELIKSSRHSKIVGSFGEHLVCNWLSRSGFEVSIVDHTGIDIVAYNPASKQRLGISVKSRTRSAGTESASLLFFRKAEDRDKLLRAGKFFAAEPWLAIYIETRGGADLFLTSLENYDRNYGSEKATVQAWSMNTGSFQKYRIDNGVKHIHIEFTPHSWW
jgi:Holliday junction resolvase-like predicted endonuclease